MAKGKFNLRPPRISKKFDTFVYLPKSRQALTTLVARNKKLGKAMNAVFSKKGAAVAATGTAVGIGIASVWSYIENNSGCFKKKSDGSVCKFLQMSCCQQNELDNVPNCDGADTLTHACNAYDETKTNSCCNLCSCLHVNCSPGETMQCQRPTVAEALSHFATKLGTGVLSGFDALFPQLKYVFYGAIVLFVLWAIHYVRPLVWKRKPVST